MAKRDQAVNHFLSTTVSSMSCINSSGPFTILHSNSTYDNITYVDKTQKPLFMQSEMFSDYFFSAQKFVLKHTNSDATW